MEIVNRTPRTTDGSAIRLIGLIKEYVPPLSFKDLLTFHWERQRMTALDGIDLDLAAGRVHAFVGPNGAGKTTLLKLVTGLLQPTDGRVEVLGLDTLRDPLKVRSQVGYCITDPRSFFLRLSGRENLRFFGILQGQRPEVRDRRTEQLLSVLELEPVADRQVLTYSEGMKQRLAIARALLHEPDILLLDEIGRGLDPRLREKIYHMFRKELVEDRGATLVIASHNMDEVKSLAHRVYVMSEGRVVAAGTHDEVATAIDAVFREEESS